MHNCFLIKDNETEGSRNIKEEDVEQRRQEENTQNKSKIFETNVQSTIYQSASCTVIESKYENSLHQHILQHTVQ
jgi:hypothetical protein